MSQSVLLTPSSAAGHRPGTRQGRYIVRSVAFVTLLSALAWVFRAPLMDGFSANVYLNGAILSLLLFGFLYTFAALFAALGEARAIRRAAWLVARAREGTQPRKEVSERILELSPPAIGLFLGKIYRVVRRGDASATLPYLLDSLATRSEDRRALVRYLTGALILLGLIGTFYGLLETLGGVRSVIGGMSAQADADTLALLAGLQERLAVPLGGMAMAFSSSLFGLLASLALAFVELQLFHAQSDVHAEMESLVVTDLVPLWRGPAAEPAATGPAVPQYVIALLQNAAERMDRLTAQVEELARRDTGADRLSEKTADLGEHIDTLRLTLQSLERERTEGLRDELRLMTRTLSESLNPDGIQA